MIDPLKMQGLPYTGWTLLNVKYPTDIVMIANVCDASVYIQPLTIQLGGVSYHDGNQVSLDEQREKIAYDLGPTNKVGELYWLSPRHTY